MKRLQERSILFFVLLLVVASCKKSDEPVSAAFSYQATQIENQQGSGEFRQVGLLPLLKVKFNLPADEANPATRIELKKTGYGPLPVTITYHPEDSTVWVMPLDSLEGISRYILYFSPEYVSRQGTALNQPLNIIFYTKIDSSRKFPVLSEADLLNTVQRQTFRYFWDFAHPVSGMARERNSSGELVTTGGTGFGLMSIPVAVTRNFISRSEGLAHTRKIVDFLTNSCTRYHGAFAHWVNGTTGATIPFSPNDNGADLVETSYLLQGLLTVREYFNLPGDPLEQDLRNKINSIWNAVEWNWFRKNNENQLYWHWSPSVNWAINMPVRGWNEALIVYILAASATTDPIALPVYQQGWAGNGSMVNNNSYYGYTLPLGPDKGGPLFFSHYSFLGIDPRGLRDAYADYELQTRNHTYINYTYCIRNPANHQGYSDSCWGLTASDIPNNGYNANEPNNDPGVIAPTAALSSMPYTPDESKAALSFYYYVLGDKLWGDYGFYDAFRMNDAWFAGSTLAIDQGPIIIMIENYRTGLLWNLLTGAPEIKNGMRRLGFTAPYL